MRALNAQPQRASRPSLSLRLSLRFITMDGMEVGTMFSGPLKVSHRI